MRRAELAAARQPWLKAATPSHPPLLVFPAAFVKNGTEFVVPLPQLAMNVLSHVQRRASSDLLFPGGTSRSSGKPASISGWSKLIQPLRKAAAARGLMKPWTLHDLRRTARSAWPTLGVDKDVCEALLNHTPADALLIAYDRRDFLAEKTQALEKWAAAIENAIGGPGEAADSPRPSAGVISLAKGAKAVRRANMQLVRGRQSPSSLRGERGRRKAAFEELKRLSGPWSSSWRTIRDSHPRRIQGAVGLGRQVRLAAGQAAAAVHARKPARASDAQPRRSRPSRTLLAGRRRPAPERPARRAERDDSLLRPAVYPENLAG